MQKSPKELIIARARELGFDSIGFARADVGLDVEHERYVRFVASGKHGTMDYLAANSEARRRLDGSEILEGAKTVICLARRYRRLDDENDPPFAKLIARYARGRDYHAFVMRRLRKLAAFIRRLSTETEKVRARPLCDTAPVLERAWAARSGIGFVGKHGLVIVPGQGSFVLLGEVVTNLEMPVDEPVSERCGSCTRCLDACPTQAFEEPFVLDPRKCISYWTIEQRGEVEAPAQIGEHVFGCDICQEVCPFNFSKQVNAAWTEPFAPHERWSEFSVEQLLDVSTFESNVASSPIKRATAEGLARNAVAVLHAQGKREQVESLSKHHPSALVRQTALRLLQP